MENKIEILQILSGKIQEFGGRKIRTYERFGERKIRTCECLGVGFWAISDDF